MATRYVYSGAGGSANGTSWANAYLTMAAAMAAPWAAADVILVASDHSETTAAAVTLTLPTTPGMKILSVNRTTGVLEVGASVAVTSGANTLALGGKGYIYGVSFLSATGTSVSSTLTIGSASTEHALFFESCSLKVRGTNTALTLSIGQISATTNDEMFFSLVNCTYSFAATAQSIKVRNARIEIIGGSLDAAGSIPSSLFIGSAAQACDLSVTGADFSALAWTYLMTIPAGVGGSTYKFAQCKFPSGWTGPSVSSLAKSWSLWILDCESGDTHGYFAYHDHLGSAVSDTGTKIGAGPSWKITTTSECTPAEPFTTPWVDWYNTNLTSMTPRFECLRNNGTATAYDSHQVHAEFQIKMDSGSPRSSRYTDGTDALGTPAAQADGVGTGSWTIASSNSPKSFRCDSGAAVTPVRAGHIRGRLHIGFAVAGTLFVDPKINV